MTKKEFPVRNAQEGTLVIFYSPVQDVHKEVIFFSAWLNVWISWKQQCPTEINKMQRPIGDLEYIEAH